MEKLVVALLAGVLLCGCGSSNPGAAPAGSKPTPVPTAPPGATQAVYFTPVEGAEAAPVAAQAMGRPVFLERGPGPGIVPAGTDSPDLRQVFLVPIAPGGEAAALARFKASATVRSAWLGRYPPYLPS